MKQTAGNTVDQTVYAWDLYCAADYDRILQEFGENKSGELRDMAFLASLEKGIKAQPSPSDSSLFAPLAQAMAAYHSKDFRMSSTTLGSWLLNKNYFSVLILERFLHAAREAQNYSLLFTVSRKFLESHRYRPMVLEPIFHSAHQTGKHKEAVALFEKFRSELDDANTIQKAALSMIQIGRYDDAEKILLALYEKITGSPYRLNIDTAKNRYRDAIENMGALQAKKKRSYEESMQLGMAYLFTEKYEEAASVFRSLLPPKADRQ